MRKLIVAAALLVPVITFVSNVIAQPGSAKAGGGPAAMVADIAHQSASVSPASATLEGSYKKLGK